MDGSWQVILPSGLGAPYNDVPASRRPPGYEPTLYSSRHVPLPRPPRRHFLHGADRPDRLRDRAADPPHVRAAFRSAGHRLRRPDFRVLGDAVPGDGAAGPRVGPDRPPADPAHDHALQCGRLHSIRVRAFVRAAVHRSGDLRVRERQHLGGAGLRGGHHDAGRALARHGHDRRGIRDRVRAGAADRRTRRPLHRPPRARPHRRGIVHRQLLLGERHPARVARRRAPHDPGVVRLRAYDRGARAQAAASPHARVVPRAILVLGLHRGATAHAAKAFGWGAKDLGWLFVVIGAIAACVQGFLFGRIERRTGARLLLILGLFGMAISIAAVPFVGSSLLVYVWTVPLAFANSLFSPAASGLVSIYADPTEQGTILGAAQAFAALGRSGGPLAAGWAYDGLGSRTAFLFASGVMLVGGLISLGLGPVSHAAARAPEPA